MPGRSSPAPTRSAARSKARGPAKKPEICPTCKGTEFRATPTTEWQQQVGIAPVWVCCRCHPEHKPGEKPPERASYVAPPPSKKRPPEWLEREDLYCATLGNDGGACLAPGCGAAVRITPALDWPDYRYRVCRRGDIQCHYEPGGVLAPDATPSSTPSIKSDSPSDSTRGTSANPAATSSTTANDAAASRSTSPISPDPEAERLWAEIGSASTRVTAPPRHGKTLAMETFLGEHHKNGTSAVPHAVDRRELPGGRIPKNAVYVGRGSERDGLGEHPWTDPCRIRRGTEEERLKVNAERRDSVEDRLQREPTWLAPLRGKNLIYYGSPDWANILIEYANKEVG